MPKSDEVSKAYARCKAGRDALEEIGARCMEASEDPAGMVWERWLLPNGSNAVVVATNQWWDVFTPITSSPDIKATIEAIRACAQAPTPQAS